MANETEYVELGLACADVCRALGWETNGKKLYDLSQPLREAINRLTTWVRPAIYSFDGSLTVLLIAEPWRRSRTDGTQSLDSSM